MHLSLARSALLMLLLLFALGNFVGVQSGQITRDADNGQLTDKQSNLQSLMKPMSPLRSVAKRLMCGDVCSGDHQCPYYCTYCSPINGCISDWR